MKGFTKNTFIEVIIITESGMEYAEKYSSDWTKSEAIKDLLNSINISTEEDRVISIEVRNVTKYTNKRR